MPATRHEVDRDAKVDDLVLHAQRLFIERGFDATTVAAVAKEAGVASNVVYWYFDSKDELFVAAMDRLVDVVIADALEAGRRRDGTLDIEAGLLCVVERLSSGRPLIAAVHDRATQSASVAAFHERVHERYAEVLTDALAQRGVTGRDRPLVVDALSTAIEGLIMHNASKTEARRMIRFLLARLAPAEV